MPAILPIEQADALAYRKGKLREFKHPVAGVAIHTTGAGPFTRWKKSHPKPFESPFDAALHIYTKVSPYCGHILICGETGRIAQLVPLDHVAHHISGSRGWRYRGHERLWTNKRTRWWRRRWPNLKSPASLLGGEAWSPTPNQRTWAIEVSPPKSGPRDPWTPEAWWSLKEACGRLARLGDLPASPTRFVTHSDLHPLTRSTKSGLPWDPGYHQWTGPHWSVLRLFDEVDFWA